jgi:hypothetical protein
MNSSVEAATSHTSAGSSIPATGNSIGAPTLSEFSAKTILKDFGADTYSSPTYQGYKKTVNFDTIAVDVAVRVTSRANDVEQTITLDWGKCQCTKDNTAGCRTRHVSISAIIPWDLEAQSKIVVNSRRGHGEPFLTANEPLAAADQQTGETGNPFQQKVRQVNAYARLYWYDALCQKDKAWSGDIIVKRMDRTVNTLLLKDLIDQWHKDLKTT